MIPRMYFDTSVFGGVYDEEFKRETEKLFEMVMKGDLICMYSDLVELELEKAPPQVINHFRQLNRYSMTFIEIDEESEHLARRYLKEGVVGKTCLDDCRHIAMATVHKADFLISWNFKHMVNVFRIRGYNAINVKSGYKPLEIRSQKDIVGHG